jgi:DNA-binding protein YbaB
MTEITGTARAHGIEVEAFPGGALSSIILSDRALARGPSALAESILDAVAEATAQANQRTKHALGEALGVLGVTSDAVLTERVEGTTPRTWRV